MLPVLVEFHELCPIRSKQQERARLKQRSTDRSRKDVRCFLRGPGNSFLRPPGRFTAVGLIFDSGTLMRGAAASCRFSFVTVIPSSDSGSDYSSPGRTPSGLSL